MCRRRLSAERTLRRRIWLACAAATALAPLGACSFDASGSGAASLDGGFDVADAGPPGPPPDDAGRRADAAQPPDAMGPCPEPQRVRIAINGAVSPQQAGQPIAEVRVGDTVTLSAAGSCVQTEPIAYRWEITPPDGAAVTALPDTASREISVFSIAKGREYTVRLTVTDGDGASASAQVRAFRVHGFERLGPVLGKIVDLSFGGGYLWIASQDGAFRWDPAAGQLLDLGAAWSFSGGESFTNDIASVWYDDDAQFVWFARKSSRAGVWRGDPSRERFEFITYDGEDALGGSTEVYDIAAASPGARLATKRGATTAADSARFAGQIVPLDTEVRALAGAAPRGWMGGKWLWSLTAPRVDRDAFGLGADNKITSMAVDADRLWVGSDGLGVAELDRDSGNLRRVYGDDVAGELPDGAVSALAVDGERDVWAATAGGIARYKDDRGMWLTFAGADVLSAGKLEAIAIDPATGDLYVGGDSGVIAIRLP